MRITFIHHSSFCVELGNKALIFDYFRGERVKERTFLGKLPQLSPEQEIYVFSSHQHHDHFDLDVLTWADKYRGIRYIFSKDIRLGENYLTRNGIDPVIKERISYMKPGESLSLDGLQVETLRSTDEGVAFVVSCEGKTIYHAGDLHWWHWEGEEPAFNEFQEQTYKSQMEKLKDKNTDVAFVVLDPRLEQTAFLGMDYFLEHVKAGYVFPMHLWQRYDLIAQFKARPEAEPYRERILDVSHENQVFEVG